MASQDAEFCLSEVKLGLVPATISPYVLAAMGERAAQRYFLTAERFSAAEAYRIGLVQEIALPADLDSKINEILGQLVQLFGQGRFQMAPAGLADALGQVLQGPLGEGLCGIGD